MTTQDRYAYLANRYPVVTRYNRLLRKISALIEATGLQGDLKINEDLLGRAVVDYFEDIDRLKDFEGIDRVAVSKIYAYQTYWLCRRKPILVISDEVEDETCVYINEIVMALMLISDMYSEMETEPPQENEDLGTFFDLLYYNLRFREYTQKSLEIMVEAFFLGYRTHAPS